MASELIHENMQKQEIASIKIGADYFRRCAKNEYSNPLPWIWVREAIQNSTDADADEIHITLTDSEVVFADDGSGMDDKIIRDKLLVLGGSFKNSENATGGFGKAKEVLFFAWDWWSIQSSPNKKERYIVTSEMIGKEPIKREVGSFGKGTIIKIKFDPKINDRVDWSKNIRAFVSTCTTKTKIYLNGEQLETLAARGSKIEYDLATIRINKSKPVDRIFIRINGITMFTRWISTGIPALVTIDLKGKSVDLLASSRESMKWEIQREFDKIVQKILTNPKSLINKEETIYIDRYMLKEVQKEAEQIRETIKAEMEKPGAGITNPTYTPELLENVSQAIEACVSGEKTLVESIIEDIKDIDPEVAEHLRLVVNGQYWSKMGYPFVVHRWHNKTPDIDPTSAKAQQILHMWKRICEEVIKDNNIYLDYVVGLTFDPNVYAKMLTENLAKANVLVNPTKIQQYGDAQVLGFTLFFSACHELAHTQCDNHDENFTIYQNTLLMSLSKDPRKWINLFNKVKAEAMKLKKEN